ncbi:MAG: hypothetical protein POH28_06745 [Acidocella sp.]|nr:hypothetical protein [Acidocella sp.]
MSHRLALAIAASLALATAAHAAAPIRVRGTIVAVSPTSITMQTPAHTRVIVGLDKSTRYAVSTKSSLSAIQPGGYIGTATKTVSGQHIALEVVVFPPSMRGAGEGHYPWDKIPDTTKTDTMTHSSMTNGNVSMAMPVPTTKSSMTNGDVTTAASTGGSKTLIVTYKGGHETILVPPTAPVVTVAPATISAAKDGASVFIVATPAADGLVAAYVNTATGGIKLAM